MQRTVLVTGATSGIGRAVALRLAERGHTVIAAGRRTHLLDELVELGAGRIHPLQLDVDDVEACAAAPEACRALVGRDVDVLVNNAGYSHPAPIELLTPEQLEAQLRTNVVGLHAITRAFVPHMRMAAGATGRRARIVNVSSEMGRLTLPYHGAYNASKHAVEALSNAARMELGPLGIDVVTVEPGLTRTEFEDVAIGNLRTALGEAEPWASIADPVARAYARSYGRFGHSAERVARLIVRSIEARRPRTRAGFLITRLQIALDRALPARLGDWVKTTLFLPSPARLRRSG